MGDLLAQGLSYHLFIIGRQHLCCPTPVCCIRPRVRARSHRSYSWLDTVPIGRVITRCTRDVSTIDGQFTGMFSFFMQLTLMLTTYFVTSIVVAGTSAFVSGGIVVIAGAFLGNVYLKAQLCVKREMSNAKAPVMSQVATVLAGLRKLTFVGVAPSQISNSFLQPPSARTVPRGYSVRSSCAELMSILAVPIHFIT